MTHVAAIYDPPTPSPGSDVHYAARGAHLSAILLVFRCNSPATNIGPAVLRLSGIIGSSPSTIDGRGRLAVSNSSATVPGNGAQKGTKCGPAWAKASAVPATVSGESASEKATGKPGRQDVGLRPASQETCRRQRRLLLRSGVTGGTDTRLWWRDCRHAARGVAL